MGAKKKAGSVAEAPATDPADLDGKVTKAKAARAARTETTIEVLLARVKRSIGDVSNLDEADAATVTKAAVLKVLRSLSIDRTLKIAASLREPPSFEAEQKALRENLEHHFLGTKKA